MIAINIQIKQGDGGIMTTDDEGKVNNKQVTDHLGNVYASVIEMCRHYNVSDATYRLRIKRGLSVEEALQSGRIHNTRWPSVQDHKGNKFDSINDMCAHWGVPTSIYRHRKSLGWSLKDILETHNTTCKESVDHLGNKYKSITDMCNHWGISISAYHNRIQNGWTVQRALETPVKITSKEKHEDNAIICDHLGKQFNTRRDMCEHWGIDIGIYTNRISRGWTVEDALTKPVIPRDGAVDHLGNKFRTKKEMYEYWGTSERRLKLKLESGYTLYEILEQDRGWIKPIDHNNVRYNTVREMCEHYNMSITTLKNRLKSGLSLKDALTMPKKIDTIRVDHTGREFESRKAMCEYWGISDSTFISRMDSGKFTLEEALTSKLRSNQKETEVIDHKGVKYKSFAEMCRAYNVGVSFVKSRLGRGMALKDALEIPSRTKEFNITAFGKEYKRLQDLLNDRTYVNPGTLINRLNRTSTYRFYDIELIVAIEKLKGIVLMTIGLDGRARYKVPWTKEYQTVREIIQHERKDLLALYDKSHPKGEWNPYINKEETK